MKTAPHFVTDKNLLRLSVFGYFCNARLNNCVKCTFGVLLRLLINWLFSICCISYYNTMR